VSSRQGARLIEQAKRKMKNITADTTPNYLLLNKEMLARRGAFLKVLPPLKSAEDSKALWAALKEGTIDCICTDHAPHLKKEKTKHFREAPSGIPSIDYYLPLIYGNAREHGIQLQQIIELTSKNPAKIFGIKNRGELKIGNFADIVVFNNKKKQKINKKDLKTKVGWSPYEGKRVLGIVEQAVVNGKLVYFDGKFNNEFLGTEIKQ
jgi:dihydroorotase (multifunctional complex type)